MSLEVELTSPGLLLTAGSWQQFPVGSSFQLANTRPLPPPLSQRLPAARSKHRCPLVDASVNLLSLSLDVCAPNHDANCAPHPLVFKTTTHSPHLIHYTPLSISFNAGILTLRAAALRLCHRQTIANHPRKPSPGADRILHASAPHLRIVEGDFDHPECSQLRLTCIHTESRARLNLPHSDPVIVYELPP